VPTTCLDPGNFMAPMGGPEPPGTGTRDVVVLPGGIVSDLGGNLFEMAADAFELSAGPCWSPSGVLHDPMCDDATAAQQAGHAARAGSWTVGGSYLEVGHRFAFANQHTSADVGFRCAWKGQ
jgi:formylglycine-generating enzyme required for sulfatase activity